MSDASKVALVTGGSRGIGRAIAAALARDGFDVGVLYAGNEAAAAQAVSDIEALGRRAFAARCDVADSANVNAAMKAVKAALGPVCALVNNAGIARDGLALRMKDADFDAVLDVNLKGAFYVARAAMGDMVRARAGRIVNITSVSGLMGNAGQANYAAAKAGLVGLTKTLARELAPRGITVNAVAPGFVETDMTGAMGEGVLEAALKAVPLGRIGRPEDIAEAVAFLVSEKAAYVTGVCLQVDGGLYI